MIGQANFLQSLGWAVLNSLWQMALLWLIYQIITGLIKTIKSFYKSLLASALLISGFGWFIHTFISAYTSSAEKTIFTSAFTAVDINNQDNTWLEQTLPITSVLYLVLLAIPLLQFVRNYRYVQVIRKYGLTKMNVEWRMFVKKIAAQMDIRKNVQIWISEFVSSPVTIGFLKPVILVPLAAINHLTPQQLEAVLLHELSHIKRFDYLINLYIKFIQTILYFNPIVKAFGNIVEKEREKSCDEIVLQFQYDSHEYAGALYILEKASIENMPLVIGASGKKNDLLHRVELIMGIKRKTVFSFKKATGFVAGLLCILFLNYLFLPVKLTKQKNSALSSRFGLPFSLEYNDNILSKRINGNTEQPFTVQNHTNQEKPATVKKVESFTDYISTVINPALIQASLEFANKPELKKYQEEQIEKTMTDSKKILESVQWKEVEKSIADVFNQHEKEQLKVSFEKEMEKIDWNKWETNLKKAYNKIDWEKINNQFSVAINQIRLDSIQLVYNKAISKLEGTRHELSLNNLKGIPDTDISLQEIERKKLEVERALNELKSVRKKKIVHL